MEAMSNVPIAHVDALRGTTFVIGEMNISMRIPTLFSETIRLHLAGSNSVSKMKDIKKTRKVLPSTSPSNTNYECLSLLGDGVFNCPWLNMIYNNVKVRQHGLKRRVYILDPWFSRLDFVIDFFNRHAVGDR